MREDILMNLQKEVYERCLSPKNQFGMGCYDHIVAVVENAKILAKRYGADEEVVLISAWLHDIVKEKLERSYQKLSDESAKFYREKYQQAMTFLK